LCNCCEGIPHEHVPRDMRATRLPQYENGVFAFWVATIRGCHLNPDDLEYALLEDWERCCVAYRSTGVQGTLCDFR
jgi:hypothetical protein